MSTVHLLTDPTPGLTHVPVVCGARLPELGSWDRRAVTCAACLAPLDRGPGPAAQTRAPVSRGLTEKQLLEQARSYARTQGWMTYHTLRSTGSEAGWVDLVLLRGPVLHLAELKGAGGKLTTAQEQWITGLRQVREVHTHVWYPTDWGTIRELLR